MGIDVRFDDSLATVLSADTGSAFGAQSAFRQIVDLIGRGRTPADPVILARLRALRMQVPPAIRVATARALARAQPPAALIRFFVEDDAVVLVPLLRDIRLDAAEWTGLLSDLGPTGRAVLRSRNDLPEPSRRALESFGATDFTLAYDGPAIAPAALPPQAYEPRSEIADLVHRIETFQRDRGRRQARESTPVAQEFAFETDASGVIRWTDSAVRGAIVGQSLVGRCKGAAIDDPVAIALRRRAGFRDAALTIGGVASDDGIAGVWHASGSPMFDPATGRFLGMHGLARWPCRGAQRAERDIAGAEALRRLVHELRTPVTAISGFAELIEREMLGPVATAHRHRADTIGRAAADLVAAIDDLDMAARLECDALALRPQMLFLAPLLADARASVATLAAARGCEVVIDDLDEAGNANRAGAAAFVDPDAARQLVAHVLAVCVAQATPGETITFATRRTCEAAVVTCTLSEALRGLDAVSLETIVVDREDGATAPLLGIGFTLRLARDLAHELGGKLVIASDALTLRLPAGLDREVQASIN